MRYVTSKVLVPVLKYSEVADPHPKTVSAAAVSVSLQYQPTSVSFPFTDFYFSESFGHLNSNKQRKNRRWLQFLSLGLVHGNDHLVKTTFREIDRENRGVITKKDLVHYAAKNGLPLDYVDAFVSQVAEKSSDAREIGFQAFQNFLLSKEKALERAFGIFDSDGDGRINVADLELSLSHVRVCCPQSTCVYKCRKDCIRQLVAKADLNKDNAIDFKEFRKFFLLLPQNDMLMDYWVNAHCSERCDMGGCVVIHDGERHINSRQNKGTNPWGHLFAGAFAGAASRTATAPLETLRLSAMTGTIPDGLSPIQAARTVCHSNGWRSLYKGNLTNVIRAAPQKALDFFAFDAFKHLLQDRTNGKIGPLRTMLAGGLAGATSNFILYPLEVVRSRLTIDSTGKYRGVLDAVQKIYRKEGVPGLYRGVGPSVAAIVPEAAIVYGLFDLSKKAYKRVTGQDPGVISSLSFGVFSAFMGQLVAYPLETVARRMQVQGLQSTNNVKLNFTQSLHQILTTDGPGGLYRGLGAASARVIPMAIVSFGTYELISRLIKEVEDFHDHAKAEAEMKQCQTLNCSNS